MMAMEMNAACSKHVSLSSKTARPRIFINFTKLCGKIHSQTYNYNYIYVYKSNFQHRMIPCLSVTKLCFESHFSHFFPLTIFVVLYIISEPFAPLEMKDCDEKMVKYTRFVASAINPKQNGFRRRQPSLPTFLFESVNLVLVSN